MKRFWMAIMVVGMGIGVLWGTGILPRVGDLASLPVAVAQDNGIKAKDLIGFYRGVNPAGGLNGFSISDNDDGVLTILVGSAFFGFCNEPDETGRGRIEGTGTITEEGFFFTDSDPVAICFREDGSVREIPPGEGTPFQFR